jgi:hypothetical protein
MFPSLPLILANSFECGWQGVNVILEREVQGEIPGAKMDFHQKFHLWMFMLGLMAMALLTRWLGRRKSRVQATTN